MNENKTTILIVDDVASARDVLVSILEADGSFMHSSLFNHAKKKTHDSVACNDNFTIRQEF